jgi:hypothetical protein
MRKEVVQQYFVTLFETSHQTSLLLDFPPIRFEVQVLSESVTVSRTVSVTIVPVVDLLRIFQDK